MDNRERNRQSGENRREPEEPVNPIVAGLAIGGGILAGAAALYGIFRALSSDDSTENNPIEYQTMEQAAVFQQLELEVVNNEWECKQILARLVRDCRDYCVLGFDTEYVSVKTGRKPITLLQLCSHSGLCCVICMDNLEYIPDELRDLLKDRSILKVGVASYADADFLKQDHSLYVDGHLDLRFLAKKLPEYNENKNGLKDLAKTFLGTTEVQIKDSLLYPKNIRDAAKDAFYGIEVFKEVYAKNFFDPFNSNILSNCKPYINKRYGPQF